MIGAVAGNYKIVDKIGEGGMGAVYKGIDMMLEREVAIKVLRPELARQPDIVERFRIEAVTLAKLNHPNIATLFSFFRQGDDYFMVMEFVRGETLENRMRRQGAMAPAVAIPLFCQALEGIDHAHRMGIVHRDIKPANMMLTEGGSIKVMDFGIARVLGSARMTKQGSIVGTIEYMSPEQILGQETDARSDIYSLGILLYEMLTGRVPFTGDSEYKTMQCHIEIPPVPSRSLAPGIPQNIDDAVLKALAKNPEDRFATAAAFREALITGVQQTEKATMPLPIETQAGPQTPASSTLTYGAPGTGELSETRVPPAGQRWSNLYGSQIKETRLPNTPRADAGPPVDQAEYWRAQMQVIATTNSNPSMFSRLKWQHYVGGLLVLGVLMAAPFVIVFMSLSSAEKTPNPVRQPVQPPSSQVSASPPPSSQSASPVPLVTPSAVVGQPIQPGLPIAKPDDSATRKPPAEKKEADNARKRAEAAADDKAKRRAEAERALDQ